MSVAREHADWLSLLEISGPFLSLPVLQRAFPQGIENVSSDTRADLRAAYAPWQDEQSSDPTLHHRWVRWNLTAALEHEETQLVEGPQLPAGLERPLPENHETLRPDLALLANDGKAILLVHVHSPGQDLTKPVHGSQWKASPDTRMAELLRGTGVPLGLVTNGERWMLVHARPQEAAGCRRLSESSDRRSPKTGTESLRPPRTCKPCFLQVKQCREKPRTLHDRAPY